MMKNHLGMFLITLFLAFFGYMGMYHDSHRVEAASNRFPSSESNAQALMFGEVQSIILKNKIQTLTLVDKDGFWVLEKENQFLPIKIHVVNDLLELIKISQKNLQFNGMDQSQFKSPPTLFEVSVNTSTGLKQNFRYLLSNPLDQSLIYESKGMYYQAFHTKTYYSHLKEEHLLDKKIFNLERNQMLSLSVKKSTRPRTKNAKLTNSDGTWRDHQNRIVHPKVLDRVIEDLEQIEIEKPLENASIEDSTPFMTLEIQSRQKHIYSFSFYPTKYQKDMVIMKSTLHNLTFLLQESEIHKLDRLEEFSADSPDINKLFY